MRHNALASLSLLLVVACGKPADTDTDTDTESTVNDTDDTTPSETDDTTPGETDDTDDTDVIDDTDSVATIADLAAGDLVITEIMINPEACFDDFAEYIEFTYTGSVPVNLEGLRLEDNNGFWLAPTRWVVQPGSTHVIWRQPIGGQPQCYGLSTGRAYTSAIALAQADHISLSKGRIGRPVSPGPNAVLFDEVDYSSWSGFTPPAGASIQLSQAVTTAAGNDAPSAWCASTVAITGSTDLGTPGATNPPCDTLPVDTGPDTDTDTDSVIVGPGGDLIFSEVADPLTGSGSGRFIEVANPTAGPVDLSGWRIERYCNGSMSTCGGIDLGPGVIPAGGTWVIAKNAGGFSAVYPTATSDQLSGVIDGNGDDVYTLLNNGTLTDIHGVVGIDGTGETWEYEDRVAVRVDTVTSPRATFLQAEWIYDVETDATPGVWPNGASVPTGPTGDTGATADTGDTDTAVLVDTDTDTDLDTGLPLGIADLGVGDLVITEFMADPSSCSDTIGEYIEVVVLTNRPVALDGLTIADAAQTVTYSGPYVAMPGEHVSLNRNTPACYGQSGVGYGSIGLNNGGDLIQVGHGGASAFVVLDEVDYQPWPTVSAGLSYQLDPRSYDTVANDDLANWCLSTNQLTATDAGTPGAPNTACTVVDTGDTGADTAGTGDTWPSWWQDSADTGLDTDTDTDLPVDTDTDTEIPADTDLDTDTGIPADTGLDTDTDVPVDTDTAVPVDTDTEITSIETGLDTDPAPDTAIDTFVDTVLIDTFVDTAVPAQGVLIITEVADPIVFQLRFIELTNVGGAAVDLSDYALERYANTNTTSSTISLGTGIILPGDSWVIGNTSGDFLTAYGSPPDARSGSMTGNGDDAWALTLNGTTVDLFGEVGLNPPSTGSWNYLDQTAQRVPGIASGSPSFTLSEWTFQADTAVSFRAYP